MKVTHLEDDDSAEAESEKGEKDKEELKSTAKPSLLESQEKVGASSPSSRKLLVVIMKTRAILAPN